MGDFSYGAISRASDVSLQDGPAAASRKVGHMRKHDEMLLRSLRVKHTLETLTPRESALFARLGQKKREESLVHAQRFTGTSRYR
jgi:hypothetical protein